MLDYVRIFDAPLPKPRDIQDLPDICDQTGGIVSFQGYVRADKSETGLTTRLHLQHYPGLTEHHITAHIHAARKHWSLEHVLVMHRVGDMHPGDEIVRVEVYAIHRRDAFMAADFIMDVLKSRIPFWKKEITEHGAQWIEPREDDYADLSRWEKVLKTVEI